MNLTQRQSKQKIALFIVLLSVIELLNIVQSPYVSASQMPLFWATAQSKLLIDKTHGTTFNEEPECKFNTTTDRLQVAATVIGVVYEELWLALHNGETVVSVAASQGFDAAFVVNVIVREETQMIQVAVTHTCLSQEVADKRIAALPESITTFLYDETAPWFITCRKAFHDRYLTAASLFGIDYFELRNQIEQGQALLEIAAKKNFTQEMLRDALIDAEITYIDEWVASGCVAAADAALWVRIVPNLIDQFLADDVAAAATIRESKQAARLLIYMPLLLN